MNLSTPISRVGWIVAIWVGAAIAARPATAQDKAGAADSPSAGSAPADGGLHDGSAQVDKPRFSETFRPAGLSQKVRLTIEPAVVKQKWHVHIVSADADARMQLREVAPDWIAAPHYGFEVLTKPVGDGVSAVILTALPGVNGDSPPSGTQYQIVWRVTRQHGSLQWTRIDTARYSTLDGGTRYRFGHRDGSTQLVRQPRGGDSILCGAAAKRPVLFEQYDPDTGEFNSQLDVEKLVENAAALKVARSAASFHPPPLPAWYQWFAASSDRRSPTERGALIRPLELGDQNLSTGWMEGVDGLGRGEFVSAQVNKTVALSSVRIVPTLRANDDVSASFAHPTRLLIALGDGSRFTVDLSSLDADTLDSGEGIVVELPRPRKTRCLSVMILAAERGERVGGQPSWTRDTTLMAEITPYSVLHGADAQKTARRIVDKIANTKSYRTRQRISDLAASLETQLVDQVRRGVEAGTPAQRQRIIPLMATLPADDAVPMLLKWLRKTDSQAAEYRSIRRGLAAHQLRSAPGLVDLLDESSLGSSKRVDVLRLLGRVGNASHLEALIDRLGQGSRAVRNERVRALGFGGPMLVEPLVGWAHDYINSPAGLDALRALAILGKRLHYDDQGNVGQSNLFLDMLAHARGRRTIMQALEVAKYFFADGLVDAVDATFADHEQALVRRAAMRALGRYSGRQARQILIAGLGDPSPDVRIAAVSALAGRQDAPRAVDAVLNYTDRESWKPGLQQAFRLIAHVKTEQTTNAFEHLLRQKPGTEAALLAAQALDRAGRTVDPGLVCHAVEDKAIPMNLRLEMLDLLGLDSSRSGERFLVDALHHNAWKDLAESSRDRRQIREHVLLSLGRRRSQAGLPSLLELARKADRPAVQQTALRALAFYSDPSIIDALGQWKESAKPQIRDAVDDTVTMIQRRRALKEARSTIDDIVEDDHADASGQKSETNSAGDASEK